MTLFFEVTLTNDGDYLAACPRIGFNTKAGSLEELHGNILDGMQAEFGESGMPAMRDVHLIMSRE